MTPTDRDIVERLAKLVGYPGYEWDEHYSAMAKKGEEIFDPLSFIDDAMICQFKMQYIGLREEYADRLYLDLAANKDGKNIHTRLIFATARQRCEAMYRVLLNHERDAG